MMLQRAVHPQGGVYPEQDLHPEGSLCGWVGLHQRSGGSLLETTTPEVSTHPTVMHSCSYRSGTVNSNMDNSKFHLI